MAVLYFVTPAWGRYEMVRICLEQRRRVIEELRLVGIEAHQVVVADDENLNIAVSVGAHTVRRDNRSLGAKFNDGMQYAGENGADWIVPIGSDSWIVSDYFYPLTDPSHTLTSPTYASVTRRELVTLRVAPQRLDRAAGPYVFHRSLLEPCGFRPAGEALGKGVDRSTVAGIRAHSTIIWEPRTIHPFQYIGFRYPPFLTSHQKLSQKWGVGAHVPWPTLAEYYPRDLVKAAQEAMGHD